jgi:hypothetical protein
MKKYRKKIKLMVIDYEKKKEREKLKYYLHLIL